MRLFTLAGILLLLSLVVVVSTPAHAAKKHGCAPLIPPPVSGTLVQPPALHGTIFINEIMLQPGSNWNCSELNTFSVLNDSWVEIYNAQNQPFDLYSAHVSIDSGPNTNPFYLPFGSAIPPHGFLIVFPRQSAPFLQTETQNMRLLIGAIPVDTVSVPSVGIDQSYARQTDGGTIWSIASNPSIDASNNIVATQAPTATPTHVHVTATVPSSSHNGNNGKNQKGSTSSNKTSNTGSKNNNSQNNAGLQPTWGTLKNTSGLTPTTIASSDTNPTTSTTLAANSGGADFSRKILLTVLIAAFAAVLFWCWRLFK